MRKIKRLLLVLCALLPLSGCAMLELEADSVASQPPLELLQMPAYENQEVLSPQTGAAGEHMRVDLWLDASQLMGGINLNEESLYPHYGRKYREGGFHYRYGSTVGWYENVLQDMLAAAGNARARVLRAGNERLTDAYLQNAGFVAAAPDALRSLRRDMLTYAVNPMPDLFSTLSGEDMANSFYSLGSPLLNQMSRFAADDGADLENPGMTALMSAALDRQIAAFQEEAVIGDVSAVGDDGQSPLVYALENIDLTRLSVITCDPATLRRLNGTTLDGAPVDYISRLLSDRGVFDAGLKVGLYAMRLDYMGQMSSFGSADFSEPLLWGRLDYDTRTGRRDGPMPMPRIMLALVVGAPDYVDSYTAALNLALNSDINLRGQRGPQEGQLSYTANGQTVTQQPFSFDYYYTDVERPTMGYYTQHTEGLTVELPAQDGQVTQDEDGYYTLRLSAGKSCEWTLNWPAAALDGGVALDLSTLTNPRVEVIDSLLLSGTIPNTPDAVLPDGEDVQVITLRDTHYLFKRVEEPFALAPEKNPFTLTGVTLSGDGGTISATVTADRALMTAGYYRLRVVADVSGEQLSWSAVGWTEESAGLNVEITNGQIVAWENFTALMTREARDLSRIPRQFEHAWGEYTSRGYQGEGIPDFPPVYQALHLTRLFNQLRDAANVRTVPYIRCVTDLFFVGN